MKRLFLLTLALFTIVLFACGGDDSKAETFVESDTQLLAMSMGFGGDGEMSRADEFMESAIARSESSAFESGEMAKEVAVEVSAEQVQDDQRDVISTASLSIEVDVVAEAVVSVRMIAEGNGGFVETLSTSGVGFRQDANVTIRVPRDRFDAAVEQISRLGDVPGQHLSSEDVTEEAIDLKARLNASIREEQSLLALLARADSVADVLGIERELTRVRSQIERLQGQINVLQSRIDMSTIYITLFSRVSVGFPPSATLDVESLDVIAATEAVKAMVARLEGELGDVVLTVDEGKARAYITLTLFRDDLQEALVTAEGLGEVTFKSLQEGKAVDEAGLDYLDEPDANVVINLSEPGGLAAWLIVVIVVGSVAFAGVLGGSVFLSYRLGRGRRAGL